MRESTAARALLAHFNHQLAGRIVRRLLKVENKDAWKRLSTAIFDLLPRAAEEAVWKTVLRYANDAGEKYIATPSFQKRATDFLETNADRWLREAVDRAMKDRAAQHVAQVIKAYDVQVFLKTISGKYQALVDEEVRRLAKEAAAQKAVA